jgi:hypothetical protein
MALDLAGCCDEIHLDREMHQILRRYQQAASHLGVPLTNLEDLICLVDLQAGGDAEERRFVKEFIVTVAQWAFLRHRHRPVEDNFPVVPLRHLLGGHTRSDCGNRPKNLDVCAYQSFVSRLLHRRPPPQGKPDKDFVYQLDAVVTLNYDLLIEDALINRFSREARIHYGEIWHSEKPYAATDPYGQHFQVSRPRGAEGYRVLPLIKLHGSLNWIANSPNKPEYVESLWNAYAQARPGKPAEINRIPIVAPTWRKNPVDDTIFATLMAETREHLQRASKIVVIGYSMPETDSYFRYLLATALNTPELPTVEIWDRQEEGRIRPRFERMFGPIVSQNLQYHDTGLDGFLRSEVASDAVGARPVRAA